MTTPTSGCSLIRVIIRGYRKQAQGESVCSKFVNDSLRRSMPVPRVKSHFNHRKQNTSRGQKTLGSLPVLLMALKAPLQFCDTSAIAVAHQTEIGRASCRERG